MNKSFDKTVATIIILNIILVDYFKDDMLPITYMFMIYGPILALFTIYIIRFFINEVRK